MDIQQLNDASFAVYQGAPLALRCASERFSLYTGIRITEKLYPKRIKVLLTEEEQPGIGDQGYKIKSTNNKEILITANTTEGATNALYTMIRELIVSGDKDPFTREWDVEEQPYFKNRGMGIAMYSMWGYRNIDPEGWTFEEWKEYIDFMRLFNVNLIIPIVWHMYNPDIPHTQRFKPLYEMLRKVMLYSQGLGMKFHLHTAFNAVPTSLWFQYPQYRARQGINFFGSGFCWSRAKDYILKLHRYMLDYFREMDGLQLMFTDGGAMSNCPDCQENYINIMLDAVKEHQRLLDEVGSSAEIIFWNWNAGNIWPQDRDRLLKSLPPGISFVDMPAHEWRKFVINASKRSESYSQSSIREHAQEFLRRPLCESLQEASQTGFKATNLFYFMNHERGLMNFPAPFLEKTIKEVTFSKNELNLDGIYGYRHTPLTRFFNDYAYFRLISNPCLTMDELTSEMAAFLSPHKENQKKLKEGILFLEKFWKEMKDKDALQESARLFQEVKEEEKTNRRLKYLSDAISLLPHFYDLSREKQEDKKEKIKDEIFNKMKEMYMYQGYTVDFMWQPTARQYFYPQFEKWTELLTMPFPWGPGAVA